MTKYICPNCGIDFKIPDYRVNKSKNHYCSQKCVSQFTAVQRSKKLTKREYPFKCGVCLQCGKDIIAIDAQFFKEDRVFCSYSCHTTYRNKTNNPMKNMATRIKVGIANTGKRHKLTSEQREVRRINNLGSKSHFWKGGLTEKNRLERNSAKTKQWIKDIFERDNWTCQTCGSRNGNGKNVYLSAHHIKSWSKYPELRYEMSNGITLCKDCHRKTPNFAYKLKFQHE